MTWGDTYLRGAGGGVRIFHVDNRLFLLDNTGKESKHSALDSPEAFWDAVPLAKKERYALWTRFINAAEWDPDLEGDDPLNHQIEIVPRDGSARFRSYVMIGQTDYWELKSTDLYGPGDVFSMERCGKAFPHAPYMNNGGTMDYSVTVELYDPVTMEAVITISKTG